MRYRIALLMLILSIMVAMLGACKVYDSATGEDVMEENQNLLQQIEEEEAASE